MTMRPEAAAGTWSVSVRLGFRDLYRYHWTRYIIDPSERVEALRRLAWLALAPAAGAVVARPSFGRGLRVVLVLFLFMLAADEVVSLLRLLWRGFRARRRPSHHVTISASGVTVQTGEGATSFTWQRVQRVADDGRLTVLDLGPPGQLLLPRRSFATPAAAREFLTAAAMFWSLSRGGPANGTVNIHHAEASEGASSWQPPSRTG